MQASLGITLTQSPQSAKASPQQIQSAHVQMEMEHHRAREANRWAHSLQVLVIMGFKAFVLLAVRLRSAELQNKPNSSYFPANCSIPWYV